MSQALQVVRKGLKIEPNGYKANTNAEIARCTTMSFSFSYNNCIDMCTVYVCLMYDACDAVGYLENVSLHGCYHVNVAHWRSRLEHLNNFLLSRNIFNLGKHIIYGNHFLDEP